ncbi:34-kDa subunit of RNA polymerase III (C) [Lithohypha guttulata]|nr:34-kDa subunit of RNA polymerase III (C) [Lithohypha guttulata]
MPPARPSATPGPSTAPTKSPVGDALYEWARGAEEPGYVFTQHELLDSGLVPKNDLIILLEATRYLVSRRLFKAHDIKGQAGIGYELVEEAAAANYGGLSSDEQMVYAAIDSSGTAGIWTKTIKAKSGVHAKVLDRVYKSLETKGLIKTMKSVKHPQRKMYIRSGLTPSEEATGGTWFNDGRLDIGMIEAVTSAIEAYCSIASWKIAEDDPEDDYLNLKRKRPDDGFDEEGKGKQQKLENGKIDMPKPKTPPQYVPIQPRYQGYPTLAHISQELMNKKITQLAIPNNALQQVLDVMIYDNRLHKVNRDARADETPDDPDHNQIFMYRCFTNPAILGQQRNRHNKIASHSYSARRAQEIEDIGRGGFSEVPCLDCPIFDICGDGGPVNTKTCIYLPEWEEKMERADHEAGAAWPLVQTGRKTQPNR